MATNTEKTEAYRNVVMALARAAELDGFTERADIALAMDALGATISNICPMVEAQAIRFRNGPLLRDYQPVSEYLRKDPEPVVWAFWTKDVLAMKIYATTSPTVQNYLVHTAHRLAMERLPTAMRGFSALDWWGKAEVDGEHILVTLYPRSPPCPEPERTPEGLLPTILVEYEWLLGVMQVGDTVELAIIDEAWERLSHRNPEQFAKLTDSWWAKVECTHIGYLVTFHYDQEMP